jgi:membrane-bound metal-dependent hydrolase YbcI (DUF457 family)
MKSNITFAACFLFVCSFFTSCAAIGGVFKAGMWAGIIVVVLIIALVLWFINKMRR